MNVNLYIFEHKKLKQFQQNLSKTPDLAVNI